MAAPPPGQQYGGQPPQQYPQQYPQQQYQQPAQPSAAPGVAPQQMPPQTQQPPQPQQPPLYAGKEKVIIDSIKNTISDYGWVVEQQSATNEQCIIKFSNPEKKIPKGDVKGGEVEVTRAPAPQPGAQSTVLQVGLKTILNLGFFGGLGGKNKKAYSRWLDITQCVDNNQQPTSTLKDQINGLLMEAGIKNLRATPEVAQAPTAAPGAPQPGTPMGTPHGQPVAQPQPQMAGVPGTQVQQPTQPQAQQATYQQPTAQPQQPAQPQPSATQPGGAPQIPTCPRCRTSNNVKYYEQYKRHYCHGCNQYL